jgi:hypothetical protein
METKTINLRDLPEEFVRKAKAYAALSGMTLKDFVIRAVESAMVDEIHPTVHAAGFVQSRERKRKR